MSTTTPLLITRDETLAEEVTRLAAVAGCELRRRDGANGVGGHWRDAALILLDGPAAAEALTAGLPRRAGVVLLTRGQAESRWRSAFEVGADVLLDLPAQEFRLVELLTDTVDGERTSATGRVLAVLGGTGGAGASTLAAATAVAAARGGARSLLLDCDPAGGGLDLTVGVERTSGLRWSGLTISGGRVPSGALHEALPGRRLGAGWLTVLSCDRDGPSEGLTATSVRAVLDAGRRAGETVVCDLPRTPSEPASAVLRRADLTIVVIPAEVRACAAAASTAELVREHSAGPVCGVVRGPAPGGLLVEDIERAVGVDVLSVLRAQPGLASAVDRGGLCATRSGSRGPIVRTAGEILGVLDELAAGRAVASCTPS
ncbi:septum site-determining protein Ssd [Saccharopolyspora gloriosae]|uniref:septum site-determining protein Ssd n=1 Tax=Saccharopolyspora gloriosae TaxID=455344 RepID=UPI001FB6A30D|nr:septum site-determining protein Ssd [Saccharopolyspora gloriosae]